MISRGHFLAAAVALVLAGCAAPIQPDGVTTSTSTSGQPAAVASSSAPVPQVAKIGQTFTYPDGLAVAVTSAKRFRIGQYAAGGKPGGTGAILTVTLTNGSTQAWDAALTSLAVAYGTEGEQAEQVFDTTAGVGSGFNGKIQPGRKATAKFAFAVPAAGMGDLQIEVKPGFLEHESVLFSGAAS